jgi:hypothetical protein
MGSVAALLEFVRALRGESTKVSDVKVDRGGGDNRTLEHFADPGDDSFPLPQDFVAAIDQEGSGRGSAVGYIDPLNEQKAEAGDKRIYARDPATGAQVGEVWLKSDGSVTLSNDSGSMVLESYNALRLLTNTVTAASILSVGTGASGTFSSGEGKLITVQDGIVVGIV